MFLSKKRKSNDQTNDYDNGEKSEKCSKKEKSWVESDNKDQIDPYLVGFHIYLHPASLSKSRKALFEKQVLSSGGTVINSLPCDQKFEKITILIDDNLIDGDRISQIITKIRASCNINQERLSFIALRWLSLCIEMNSYIEPNNEFVLQSNAKALKNCNREKHVPQAEMGVTQISTDNVHNRLQDRFACAYSSDDPQKILNLNEAVTKELSKLSAAYKNSNDQWRCFGYEKAISAIKRHPSVITSQEEAASIRGVGDKMADKIAEILNSGRLQKVEEICNNEKAEVLSLFNRVWGVGPSTAEQWYYQGMRTLDDLMNADRKNGNYLNKNQKVGVALFDDLDQRMDRSEAAEIEAYVKECAMQLNNQLEVIACGSFRRGKETCGDLDVLITHPKDEKALTGLFDQLISKMHREGFLTHDLTFHKDGNQKKYLGVCKILPKDPRSIPAKHRRLDIIVVPPKEKATALMYFTGSAHFNRSMRLLATKMGMSLSEHALRKNVLRGGKSHKEKLNAGEILDTPTEESVFYHLGLPFRKPKERDH